LRLEFLETGLRLADRLGSLLARFRGALAEIAGRRRHERLGILDRGSQIHGSVFGSSLRS
jgi:hypothetical protein